MYIGVNTWMTTIVGKATKWECELAKPKCCIWGDIHYNAPKFYHGMCINVVI
jgi:hypothetical protein